MERDDSARRLPDLLLFPCGLRSTDRLSRTGFGRASQLALADFSLKHDDAIVLPALGMELKEYVWTLRFH